MKGNTAVVVGAGVCGLMASIQMSKHFERVILIEQSENVGGLFRSISDSNGAFYDYGSHIPNATGLDELDDILFGAISERAENWHEINRMLSGNFFSGSWDLFSPFPDARKLPSALYKAGLSELIELGDEIGERKIIEYCKNTLGNTFTSEIVSPILRKLYGKKLDLNELTLSAGLFGFTRILAFKPDVTSALKKIPAFDKKLGYQTFEDHLARKEQDKIDDIIYYYPKGKGGVGKWIDYLKDKAIKSGVEIKLSTKIEDVSVEDGKINSIKLFDESIDLDVLFWSAPLPYILKLLGVDVPFSPPELRASVLFHLNFDKEILNKESYYLWVWDKCTDIFRITLYPNFSSNNGVNNLTAEILCSPEEVDSYTLEKALEDLKVLGLIDESFQCVSETKQVIYNTFPVPTVTFEENNSFCLNLLKGKADNLIVSGRSGGTEWKQADVLASAYRAINKFVGL